MKDDKPTICVDFDGTIVDYSQGWQGRGVFGDVLPGAREALEELQRLGWRIIIHTARGELDKIAAYLKEKGVPFHSLNTNPNQNEGASDTKPQADVYVDDRGLRFEGSWEETLEEVKKFQPWQKTMTKRDVAGIFD